MTAKENGASHGVLIIVISIFIGSMTISSVLANKIIGVFGIFVPAGVLAYSVTFICTDVISEIWGKDTARQTIIGGFFALMTVFILVQMAIIWQPAPFWKDNNAFGAILGSTSRIIVASFIAYLVSQLNDIYLFHWFKRWTGGRHLWFRNTVSTALSQLIDSILFITIAFYGTMPVIPLIFGQWLVKFAIAVLDTPIIYLAVWGLRNKFGLQPKKAAV